MHGYSAWCAVGKCLKWKSHTSHLFSSGNLILLKSFSLLKRFSISIQNFKIIYCSYIRPCFEYACPVRHPGLTKDRCSKIKSIQKIALKLYFGCPILHTMKVWLDLNLLNWNLDVTSLPGTLVTSALVLTIIDVFSPPSKQNPPILPKTRLNARRAPNTQLHLCPQMLTMKYKNSFVPYFVSRFNN